MRGLATYQKVSEMMGPGQSPRPPRGTMGAASNPPVFTDANGNVITSAPCGSVYGFTVPGWEGKQIWLTQYQNGTKQYDGLFSIPMAPYTSQCPQDVGSYQLIAYDPVSGVIIGETTFQVLPAGSSVTATSTTTFSLSNMSTPELVLGAAAIYFLFLR